MSDLLPLIFPLILIFSLASFLIFAAGRITPLIIRKFWFLNAILFSAIYFAFLWNVDIFLGTSLNWLRNTLDLTKEITYFLMFIFPIIAYEWKNIARKENLIEATEALGLKSNSKVIFKVALLAGLMEFIGMIILGDATATFFGLIILAMFLPFAFIMDLLYMFLRTKMIMKRENINL